MSRLTIKSLSLVAPKKMLARKVEFHPETTIISGKNKAGKSSLVKSIYHSFGCQIKQKDDEWIKLKTISLVNFSIDQKLYWILRKDNKLYLFNHEKELIKRSEKLTDINGVSPELLKLLGFNWTMKTRSDETSLVTDFAFSPFYIDQDTGWQQDAWESFSGVSVCSGWKAPLIDYYSGIKPREYYTIQKELSKIKDILVDLEKEKIVIKQAKEKIDGQKNNFKVPFCASLEEYQNEIKNLLQKVSSLQDKQEKETKEVSMLYSEKSAIEKQITISEKAFKELEDDYNFVIKHFDDDHIPCPTCGTSFDNSMIERFSFLTDAENCKELNETYQKRLKRINKKILDFQKDIKETRNLYQQFSEALDIKKNQSTLKSLIKSEVRKEVDNTFQEHLGKFQEEIDGHIINTTKLQKERDAFSSRVRSKEIKTYFNDKMSFSLDQLGLSDVNESVYKNIKTSLKAQGSVKPRLILAFYISLLETMKEYFNPTWCPLVIDSPKQQEFDDINLPKVFEFIFKNRINESQLILATVQESDIPQEYLSNSKLIKFEGEKSMMTRKEFSEVDAELLPFIEHIRDSYRK